MVRGEERHGWSDIQPELLEEVLRKLTLVDYLKCRRVCRSWRSIVHDAVATKGTCAPAPQLPFLMLLPPNLEINNPATLLDMTQEDTSYTMAPPRTWRDYYVDKVYSVEGWMVFRKFYDHKYQKYELVVFHNPVSGEKLELPPLPTFSAKDYFIGSSTKYVFSSAPTSSDFFVVASTNLYRPLPYPNMQRLEFCKVADESWTLILTYEYLSTFFDNFVILDWKLYAMASYEYGSVSVTVFNLRDSNIITSERLVMLNPYAIQRQLGSEFKDGVQYYTESEVCMTRDGDELLLVLHLTERARGSHTHCRTNGFRIFKLDICGPRLIEVDDFDDRVLLIDENGIQVISAKEINLPGKLSRGNCVFFSSKNKNTRECDVGVFSLKDKSLKLLSLRTSSQGYFRCLWFKPSLW